MQLFRAIGARVDLMLDQVGEKALCEILRIFHGVPAAAHETVKRRPIGLAKLRERILRNLRFGLWLSPAATTTLQCVEGKKSLRPCPFPAEVFASAVRIKTAEDTSPRKKYDSV
jgi:hypothetical protein